MKGIVFTEFFEMVEDTFGPETADTIIEASDLPSGGAYTAVGTYNYNEMVQLVVQLSKATGISVSDLLRTFGKHLFGRFFVGYPHFFNGVATAFSFLESIEEIIHSEVRKLYPDAELPTFEFDTSEQGRLSMIYSSERGLADLAEGLILGCIDHFGERIELRKEDLSDGKGKTVRFILTKQA
ncbi:MAG: heme NO-binding domain-containing protein [bacterium]